MCHCCYRRLRSCSQITTGTQTFEPTTQANTVTISSIDDSFEDISATWAWKRIMKKIRKILFKRRCAGLLLDHMKNYMWVRKIKERYACMCVFFCVCVLDTCELISNDYADYGLADYGLHGFENLSRTKHFFLLEHSA